MTLSDLAFYQEVLDNDENNTRMSRENRDACIRHAITEGYTHQQIADATGLTRGRIGQIANAHNTKGRQ